MDTYPHLLLFYLFCIFQNLFSDEPKQDLSLLATTRYTTIGHNHFILFILSTVCQKWKAVADSEALRSYVCTLNGWVRGANVNSLFAGYSKNMKLYVKTRVC